MVSFESLHVEVISLLLLNTKVDVMILVPLFSSLRTALLLQLILPK